MTIENHTLTSLYMQMSSFNIFDHCVYTEVLCEINVHMSIYLTPN